MADVRKVPAACPMRTIPASITSPPAEVTSSACSAEARAGAFSYSIPISRYDVIEVSSQAVNRVISSSARTMPSIAPANMVSSPAIRW